MPRSFDDHVRWLIEPERFLFEEALAEIKVTPASEVKVFTYELVAMKYINYLLSVRRYIKRFCWIFLVLRHGE
jgi:hypothetical protein